MKKLGKILINPEKLMKNEDLMTLKGGDRLWMCEVWADNNYVGTWGIWTSHEIQALAEYEYEQGYCQGYGDCCCCCS